MGNQNPDRFHYEKMYMLVYCFPDSLMPHIDYINALGHADNAIRDISVKTPDYEICKQVREIALRVQAKNPKVKG